MKNSKGFLLAAWLVIAGALIANPSFATTAVEIDSNVDAALASMHQQNPKAKALGEEAKAVLVFPKIVKGGFIVGAQAGGGALRVDGKTEGYYSSFALSYGLQAGIQWFGYAMYFMNDSALEYLDKSGGWEIGPGPSIVVLDKGAARSLTTSSLKDDIYVVFFDQKGLMAGIGIQGTKITKYTPDN